MKIIYNTPEILVEELTKKDVLCASPEVDTDKFDNANLSGKQSGDAGIYDLSNIL